MSENKRPKLIHEIPVEELLKVANDSTEEIDVGKLTDAAKFIYHFNIKAGDSRITAQLIYFTYKQWIGKERAEPKWLFFRDFSKYFERKNLQGMVYFLNPKPFDQSEEVYWEMRRDIRERRERLKRQKKTNEEKKDTDETQ